MDLLNIVMSQGDVDHRTELHEELRELRYSFNHLQNMLTQNEELCSSVLGDTVGCTQLSSNRMDTDAKQAKYMWTVLKVVRGEQKMKANVERIAEKMEAFACRAREIQASISMGSVLSKST